MVGIKFYELDLVAGGNNPTMCERKINILNNIRAVDKDMTIDSLLDNFFPSGKWSVYEGSSGMNNTTRYVETNGEKYVLRIYETHQDILKVDYEHHLLLALSAIHLPFLIPRPVMSAEGNTIIRTTDGKIASLFNYIEGVTPTSNKSMHLESFGYAVGQLTIALSKVTLDKKPAYRPYYEIENTHPLCPIEVVIDFCRNPPAEFSDKTNALEVIAKDLSAFKAFIPKLMKLPHQLIHGDLNPSNTLVSSDGRIVAILDFEFVTNDLRVMEIAVCLSDLFQKADNETLIWAKIEEFSNGYGKAIKLTQNEINAIPLLVQLRRLDVFIHFLGRFWDGVDGINIVKDQINTTYLSSRWLDSNEPRLLSVCKHHLL